MLYKKNRLAKDRDIKKVFARGRGFFNPYFTLKYLPEGDAPRFTVVASTKVSKRAVKRNRLKRIIRQVLRLNLNKLPLGDYVLMLKPKAGLVPEAELLKSLMEFLKI